ncbi:alpha/beta hydrolase [Selenomonas ruminantium]|uniref:alpha/beta hydrolase n=1 Tax=Selenomonas ruminantium TaxID=971 RepID=UPI00041350BD|nr:alpha/beta hydrolase [Selenomonas ruminantium]
MQILYVHGKSGSAGESEHYKPQFPNDEVIGLDYHTFSPWETRVEIRAAVDELARKQEDICLIANSIGAFFSMNAGLDGLIQKAYFISPLQPAELSIFITELATIYKGLLRVFQVSGFPSV